MTAAANPLAGVKRLTIKIGSSLLVDTKTGQLRRNWLESLCADIAALRSEGTDVIVVSSGAIALGRAILGLTSAKKALTLDQAQAAASVGQIALSQAWRDALAKHQVITGQILVTPNITEERRQFLNARATLSTLLGLGAVPIINENDSVATAEIRYGDNDRLSARMAAMANSDLLLLFSDVDGLYTAPPGSSADAHHLARVESITPEIEAMAGGAASHLSRGGMTTKIDAAKIATGSGTAMIIAKGADNHPINAVVEGARHTYFPARQSHAAARKRWILGTLGVTGEIHVDAGAARALMAGKSLLPVGVTRVGGHFGRGDTLAIFGPDGVEIARGLASMSDEEAQTAKGRKSAEIAALFGPASRTELVHADNLVLMAADARPAVSE
ncbi:MAG: glutamate 5-kinase [Hyphomicrobiaceae bacterium]|nr:glutamate 5-kinase [Hyphomicrobiaceae bacterium]